MPGHGPSRRNHQDQDAVTALKCSNKKEVYVVRHKIVSQATQTTRVNCISISWAVR